MEEAHEMKMEGYGKLYTEWREKGRHHQCMSFEVVCRSYGGKFSYSFLFKTQGFERVRRKLCEEVAQVAVRGSAFI